MPLACLAASLSLLPPACAGAYTLSSQTGGTATATPSGPPAGPPPQSYHSGAQDNDNNTGYGAETGNGSSHGASADCEGAINTVFTWQPDGGKTLQTDPPPQQVVVCETCTAECDGQDYSQPTPVTPSPACADGLGDTPTTDGSGPIHGQDPSVIIGVEAKAKSTGTRYTVMSGGLTVTIPPCSPRASVSVSVGPARASVIYNVTVYPITLSPVGATPDGNGGYAILVGQGCSPVLAGTPGGCTVSNYSWTVTGTTFQQWSPTTPANPNANPPTAANSQASYYVNGPGPLNGPNPNSTPAIPAPHWYWNDASQTIETITCTATVTPPSNQGSPSPVTVTQKVTVMVPTFTAYGTGGYMQVNQYAPNSTGYELWAGPTAQEKTNGQSWGMTWTVSAATPTTPAFGLGNFEIVQITTPNDSYTTDTTPSASKSDPLNGITGLDGQYPYASSAESAQGAPLTTGDSPGLGLVGNTFQAASASLSPSFTDYLLYQPPGSDSQYVPVATFTWSANGSAQIPVTDSWADYSRINGSDSAGTVTPSAQTPFTQIHTFPSWTHVDVAKPY